MPIVSHTKETTRQPNGRDSVVARFYDQDGKSYTMIFNAPPEQVDALLASKYAMLDESLAEMEFMQVLG